MDQGYEHRADRTPRAAPGSVALPTILSTRSPGLLEVTNGVIEFIVENIDRDLFARGEGVVRHPRNRSAASAVLISTTCRRDRRGAALTLVGAMPSGVVAQEAMLRRHRVRPSATWSAVPVLTYQDMLRQPAEVGRFQESGRQAAVTE